MSSILIEDDFTACPRCNCTQQFKVQLRTQVGRSWYEAYIKCALCNWEQFLYYTTTQIESSRRRVRKVREMRIKEIETYGEVREQTELMKERVMQRHEKLVAELEEKISAAVQ